MKSFLVKILNCAVRYRIQEIEKFINTELEKINIYNITENDFISIFQGFSNSYYGMNYNSNESLKIRYMDLKGYFLDFHQSGDLLIQYEVLLLKMFKYGLLDITIFDFKHDIDTKEGKAFYVFMDKYILKSDTFRSGETGEVEYDLEKIINNEYKKFIRHIFKNIKYYGEKEDFDYDEVFGNRLLIESKIKNIGEFFNKLHYLINKKENNTLFNEVIDKLNNGKGIIEYDLNTYVKEKSFIYFYIKYLEEKGKLKINSIEIHYKSIKYNIELIVHSYHELMFVNFSFDNVYKKKSSFINNILNINGEEIKINKTWKGKITQLWEVLDLIYKAKLLYGNKITHTQLLKLRNKNNYIKIKGIMFDYNFFHNTLKDKEKIINKKGFGNNFFGVTEEGINLKF